MILKDWDIWLNYSGYFLDDIDDIQSFCKSLVENKICKVVYDTDGFIFYEEEDKVKREVCDIIRKGYETEAKIMFPKILNNYILEGTYQASNMRFQELFLFNSKYLEKFSYIRGFLGACYFKQRDRIIALYPQIKIYKNGVYILSYRIISNKSPYLIKDFIENEINLFRYNSDNIDVPPEWVKLDTRSIVLESYWDLFTRRKLWKFVKEKDKLIDKYTKTIKEEDFSFDSCPLDLNDKNTNVPLNVNLLTEMIMSSLSYILNNNREGMKYIIKGQRKNKNSLGNFWYGQPSIFILSYRNQPYSSKKIITDYLKELTQIMMRTTYQKLKNSNDYLGKDLRVFDDYSVFMEYGIILFIYSKLGLRTNKKYADPNRGHLIYDKQILVESLIYLYMNHMRQIERSFTKNITTSKIIKEKQYISELEELTKNISNFGEINNIFKYASEKYNLRELREKSEKNLELRDQDLRERSDKFFKRFSVLISILFGLIGVFPFADNISKPIWKFFNLPTPCNPQLNELFLPSITLVAFLFIIFTAWKFILSKNY